jgi:hypothetical protein
MKIDIPGSRLTNANDSGRPVIPPETDTQYHLAPCDSVSGGLFKTGQGALRLEEPDAQKQPALSAKPYLLGHGRRLPNVATLMKINMQQHGR